MTAAERREAIIDAATPLFARRGFKGVTTREVAGAAGVSEALLYKHFPSKESLYHALQANCMRGSEAAAERIGRMPAGTATLVRAIHHIVTQVILGTDESPAHHDDVRRLMLASLLDDGAFARSFLSRQLALWQAKMIECMHAARESGDIAEMPVDDAVRLWMAHHLAAAVTFYLLPKRPVVDYGVGRQELARQVARVALRAIGLTDAALRRHYKPDTWVSKGNDSK
jgi:AcrR family transcriptional regulator